MADTPYELNAAEREEEEKRRREKLTLDQEIARKYDVNRLSKVVLEGAGRGERLDLATRSVMERVLPGHDFSKVRVFRGSFAEEITAKHKADAVTIANTGMILMRESARSAPGTRSAQALLAHELTHVAQAQRGMHFALEGGGGEGAHEHEAEAVEQFVSTDSHLGPPGGDSDGSQQGGKENEKSKAEHRRRKVLERCLEMLGDIRRQNRDRQGRTS
jgi:Domain of unknown function (DUF4157)